MQQATGASGSARASLQQALRRYRELGDQLSIANALIDLAGVELATGDHQSAAKGLATALDLYRDIGDQLGTANALNMLGTVQRASGDLAAAAITLRRALGVYRKLGDPAGEAESLVNLGNVAFDFGETAPALDHFEQARIIAIRVTLLPVEATALEGIGRCRLQDGRPTEGAAALSQALAMYRQIGSPSADRVERLLGGHS